MDVQKAQKSPLAIGLKVAAAIGAVELCIMVFLSIFDVADRTSQSVIDLTDSLLLSILASFVIFVWIVRPMRRTEHALARRTEDLERSGEELRKRNGELSSLFRISIALSREIHLSDLVQVIQQVMTDIDGLPVERSGIFLIEDGKLVILSPERQPDDFVASHKDLRVGDCLCGIAAQTGEIIVSPDSSHDHRYSPRFSHLPSHGHVIVPLKARDRVIGILFLYLPPGIGALDESHMQLLQVIGSQIGVALENAKYYQESVDNALHDHLTGLANRRMLDAGIGKNIAFAKRSNEPLAALMADIDNFKHYNDTHGHDAGDALLVTIAELFRREVREADLVARYGGEEFCILMPGTTEGGARELAERIRHAVQTKTGETLSLGVAVFRAGMGNEDLIKHADRALYEAKRTGKNRMVLAR